MFAGVVGTLLGFPLDTIKTRMQTRPDAYSSMPRAFSKIAAEEGVRGFFRGILPPLGALTLLNTMNFGAYAKASPPPTCARFHSAAESRHTPHPTDAETPVQPGDGREARALLGVPEGGLAFGQLDLRVALAGAAAGPLAAFVSTPFELVKIQLMLDGGGSGSGGGGRRSEIAAPARRFRGSAHAAHMLFVDGFASGGLAHGAAALYRGHGVNSAREVSPSLGSV